MSSNTTKNILMHPISNGVMSDDILYPATSIAQVSGLNDALSNKLDSSKCTFQTSAPTADISDGGVHIVYLASEPSTKYNGYIYLIAEAS